MKKVEMNTQTLETSKTNLKHLEVKLDDLQLKRRDLFNQLKKVLNEETTLKKNNRPPITLTPQAPSNMSFMCGQPSQLAYQQLISSQFSQHEPPGIHNNPPAGLSQLINATGSIAAISKTPPNSSILRPGVVSSPSNNGHHTGAHLANATKPQSPFHPPQMLHHLGQNFPLIPPGGLKYAIPTSLSPQILTAHQHASPSSSPRHQQPPINTTNPSINSTPNSKRPRSPSPHISHFQQNNQLTPSRPPSNNTIVTQSPPPNLKEHLAFNSSPSSNQGSKKTRTNNLMVSSSSSPALNSTQTERMHMQNRQANQNNFIPGLTSQQQSAFSAYQQSLLTGRPGPLNPSFQSPQQQPQSNTQQQHTKLNKSPNLQPQFQPPSSPQSFLRGNLQPPSLPPPSHSPLNFNTMSNHYLNQLAKEATNKILQQQAQQNMQHHQSQHHIQQHLIHQQQIQMLAAAAATHHNQSSSQNNNNDTNTRLSNSAAPSTTGSSGGGSILTGFASNRSASNPSQQQRPPSNY